MKRVLHFLVPAMVPLPSAGNGGHILAAGSPARAHWRELIVAPPASHYAVTVPPGQEPALSLSEWIVLSLVCEGPTHGNAVTLHLARYGDLGRVWNVQKAVVYRSLDRLTDLGLLRSA